MSKLKFSIITSTDLIENILWILDDQNNGFENFIGNLPSYALGDLVQYAKDNWWIYGIWGKELEGIVIYQWPNKRTVNLHACSLNNKRNWIKYYKAVMMPEIAKHADYHMILLKKRESARKQLFERYGFKFKWDKGLNSYKSLQKL